DPVLHTVHLKVVTGVFANQNRVAFPRNTTISTELPFVLHLFLEGESAKGDHLHLDRREITLFRLGLRDDDPAPRHTLGIDRFYNYCVTHWVYLHLQPL